MITRIELDGFKTFVDFAIDIAPFQMIIGANGAGKSNLFDALRLLSSLANGDINEAFQELASRGTPDELFTIREDGGSEKCMTLAVELFVEPEVVDRLGQPLRLTQRRFRYEVQVCRRPSRLADALYIAHESLTDIQRDADPWIARHSSKFESDSVSHGVRETNGSYITTKAEPLRLITTEESTTTPSVDRVVRMQSHDGSHSSSAITNLMRQTMLSTVINADYLEVLAVQRELMSWRFLLLWNLEAMRAPAAMLAATKLDRDGAGLAAVLGRMYGEDPTLLIDVSREIANLVRGISRIEVDEDHLTAEFRIRVTAADGRSFSARLLSDGTLRLLALAALKHDPEFRGVLCIEEPENGVPPYRLADVARLLRELATDFSNQDDTELPLRQVLINTHSPQLVNAALEQKNGSTPQYPELMFAHIVSRVAGGGSGQSLSITRMVPVTDDPNIQRELDIDDREGAYTLRQVRTFLGQPHVNGQNGQTHKNGGA